MRDGSAIADRLEDIVHADTQVGPRGVDLTADAVYRLDGRGHLDFGGGEYEPAPRERVAPQPPSAVFAGMDENDDGDYGWWDLDEGTYLVSYNEALAEDTSLGVEDGLVLEPHEHLLAGGARHPTVHVDALEPVPVAVPATGIRIKENARVSTLRLHG